MYATSMAVRMAQTIHNALTDQLTISSVAIFTDSEIVLNWLATYPIKRDVGRFVTNRIVEIRAIVSYIDCLTRFGHVTTNENPADSATRDLSAKEMEIHLWWEGPDFLKQPEESWSGKCRLTALPKEEHAENVEVVQQTILNTETTSNMRNSDVELLDWSRHRTLESAQTSVAYALRFLRKLCGRTREGIASRITKQVPELTIRSDGKFITVVEREAALRVIIRAHQCIYVSEQLRRSLKNFNLQPDQYGILRCRERLDNASIPESAKHPMFVAPKTTLAFSIIKDAHLPLHLGISHTMATVRRKFWIPKLRQQVQRLTTKCVPCQRMNALPFPYPSMGPLPKRRVIRTKPFENVGIDYFGPLVAKGNDDKTKVYRIIITCMTTRMIHVEVVTDTSIDKLLLALRRFFARRGVPKTITSDNGPSFVLGDQVLKDSIQSITNDDEFQAIMTRKGIEWTTITPYAPWQGAFYERLIKSIKHSFYQVVGNRLLNEEELRTLMAEIEGTLNTRPLTYQGADYEPLRPLRPIDFIVKDIEITYPVESSQSDKDDPDYLPSEELFRLQTRRQAQESLASTLKATEYFWKIWHKIYLHNLREAHKKHMNGKRAGNREPKEGMVVLLADDNLPRNTWKMGRISALKPGKDGAIREVELHMPSGNILKRPINLFPCPSGTERRHRISERKPTTRTRLRSAYRTAKTTKRTVQSSQHNKIGPPGAGNQNVEKPGV
uniref:Integrase catalytic domain-containing protein n=1 Tax=Haemonchus contortus TaxID=6289 RepID=A0A7I4Y6G6_HAECO